MVLGFAVVIWFGVVFQSLLFQRYRLQRNESALRKGRLFDAYREEVQFRNKLLGEVKSENAEKRVS